MGVQRLHDIWGQGVSECACATGSVLRLPTSRLMSLQAKPEELDTSYGFTTMGDALLLLAYERCRKN